MTLLLMLDDACPSPCYVFQDRAANDVALPLDQLRHLLDWLSQTPDYVNLALMIGRAETVTPQVAALLTDIADQLLYTPRASAIVDSLRLTDDQHPTLIIDGPGNLDASEAGRASRPCILHVAAHELPELSHRLQAHCSTNSVVVRPKCLHRFTNQHMDAWGQVLLELETVVYRTAASGRYTLPPRDLLQPHGRCPAGSDSLTVGPDARLYPCPAFYHAGAQFALGPLRDIGSIRQAFVPAAPRCPLCESDRCVGCRFLAKGPIANRDRACRLAAFEQEAAEQISRRVAGSTYLFDGLRTVCTRQIVGQSAGQGVGLTADQQTYDIRLDDFADALRAVSAAVTALSQPSPAVAAIGQIKSRWQPSGALRPGSRRWVFHQRLLDLLCGLETIAAPPNVLLAPTAAAAAPAPTAASEPSPFLTPEQRRYGLRLYQILAGWQRICHGIASDSIPAPDPVEQLSLFRCRDEADREFQAWLRELARSHVWPRSGTPYAVDFITGRVRVRAPLDAGPPERSPSSDPPNSPVDGSRSVELGPADQEVLMRMGERLASLESHVRALLCQLRPPVQQRTRLTEAIRRVGAAYLRRQRWFARMRQEHAWAFSSGFWHPGPNGKTITWRPRETHLPSGASPSAALAPA